MACFENIAIEDLDACINSEVQAGVSEVVYYGVHAQITTFPMPLNVNDVGYDYEGSCSNGQLCLQQEKVSEKLQYNLIQERWLMLWVTKETRKQKFICFLHS
jgi:hypothetical protein